jgi:drug/metabolite transporter (DMT)-like permease
VLAPKRSAWPTAEPFGPGSAVVVFGIASAIAWGSGDFGGGWASRRAPVLGISLIVQVVGVLLYVGLAILARETSLVPATIAISVAAGVVVTVGIIGLYQGLAVGRMGVVAPVTGLIAALLPVTAGIVRDGLPATPVLAGIVLALVAVVFVSRVPGQSGSRSGIELAIVAGVGIGLFNILAGELPDGQVFGPLVVIKVAAATVIAAALVVGRRAWRMPPRLVAIALAVGVFDMIGNACYVLAAQSGRLDVAATLSSLYPVTTILLAVAFLGERVTRSHAMGIAAAIAAIALIGAGSAG